MNALCVDPAHVHEIWPNVSSLIYVAMARGKLGSFAEVKKQVLAGKYLLWLAHDGNVIKGAVVTSLETTEWDKSCIIVACGGKDIADWIEFLPLIEKFAQAEGCNRILLFGREGWQRILPQYRPMRVVLERKL